METGELLLNGLFYLFAAMVVGGALGVALSKNIVRSAFALLGVLLAVAALYALMKADFLVAAQVFIYVGGILVLIIFAVMLTHKITDVKISNDSRHSIIAVLTVLGVAVALGLVIFTGPGWTSAPVDDASLTAKYAVAAGGKDGATLTEALGRGLMTDYLLPFEVISVLLLAALVGAAYLARKEVKE